jgi:hypothetical protein
MAGILALSAFIGCSKTPKPNPKESVVVTTDMLIEPHVGVGPIRIGASTDNAIAALGQPDARSKKTVLIYHSFGVEVIAGTNLAVRQVFLKPPFSGKTKEGIGLGSTRESVIAKLGTPTKSEKDASDESLQFDSGGLRLFLKQGKVVYIQVVSRK